MFESFLEEKQIRFLVYTPAEDSLPVKWLSIPGNPREVSDPRLVQVASEKSTFGPDVALYRIKAAP